MKGLKELNQVHVNYFVTWYAIFKRREIFDKKQESLISGWKGGNKVGGMSLPTCPAAIWKAC
jgi:hypothetical protein